MAGAETAEAEEAGAAARAGAGAGVGGALRGWTGRLRPLRPPLLPFYPALKPTVEHPLQQPCLPGAACALAPCLSRPLALHQPGGRAQRQRG